MNDNELDEYRMDESEMFWLGLNNDPNHIVVNRMQSETMQKIWFESQDGLKLDPHYSELCVRFINPGINSLSFTNQTLAIIPKSKLAVVYRLIGEYLDYEK